MSKNVVLPDEVYQKAVRLAQTDKVSVDDFVTSVLADQLAAREYLDQRASHASREKFRAALDQIPDVEPEDHDRL